MAEFALHVDNVWFWYREGVPVLRGLDLAIGQGEFVALVGANGSGKTTLAKHFNGLLRPERGEVRVGGKATAHRSIGELARQAGFLFQHPEHQIFSPTVRKEVSFGPQNQGLPSEQTDTRVQAALARFDLLPVADMPPAILSYGLRRRVTLASLAAMDTPILVLDEPTVGLDARGVRESLLWLVERQAAGRTILFTSHDMALVAEYADRVVVLKRGQIMADGPPSSVFLQTDLLADASLQPPPVAALAQRLQPYGFPGDVLTVDGFCSQYQALVEGRT